MLQDVVHPPPPHLPMDDISTPINAQIFELYNSDLFPETLQNSEGGASCSNYCYEDNSSYSTTLALPSDINKFTSTHENNGSTATTTTAAGGGPPATSTTATTTANANNSSNLSIIFDSQEEIENEITASLGFSASPPFSVPQFFNPQTEQFDIATIQTQIQISDVPVDGLSQFPPEAAPPLIGGPPLSSMCEDECLSSLPSYMRLNPSSPPPCSFVDPASMGSYLLGNFTATLSGDSSGIFSGGVLMGPELQPQELDQYQGDNGGIYCQDSMQRVFNSAELQALSNENQQLVGGGGGTANTPLASEISSLEESTFKVGKLSVEQRKEKIHRYMKKRNERNFSKKIKYACRKTLADSRPRVRGRFAKNDDFGEAHRTSGSHHEEDDEEDMGVKEEDDLVDSSDILAHISGVNSFKCNYPIQSWI